MQAIHVQLVHMVYTQIYNHLQIVRNAPLEATVQALLVQQSLELAQLVIIARLVRQQLHLQVHRAGALANVLDITSVERVSVLVHHLYPVFMIRQ
jgi:hypothetical protein